MKSSNMCMKVEQPEKSYIPNPMSLQGLNAMIRGIRI